MKTETFYFYEGRTDVSLTAYLRCDSPEITPGVKRGAVLICPGGGYFNCSDAEAEPVALRFAAMGYNAFVLRYSTYLEGKSFDFGSFGSFKPEPNPRSRHPIPMLDIARAVLMIKDHSDEWLVDPDKIAVCGFSAGAHNTAMFCTYWHTELVTKTFGRPAEDFRPAACILGYMLSDYLFLHEANERNPFGKEFFAASNTAFLGTAEPSDALLDEVSPARHVTEKNPPAFLWATSEDALVPVQNSLLMGKALADHGVPFEMHIYETGMHGLSLANYASAVSKANLHPQARNWVNDCEAFLERRFAIELPDAPSYT